jgi:hypothetical protein
MKSDEGVGAMPMTLAAEGASGGALDGASRGDLSRGYTKLGEPPSSEGEFPEGGLMLEGDDRDTNQIWTEGDAGGFLKRPHGLER